MKEKKNIERLFQEKFKDFEVSPPSASWNEIQRRLQKKSKKRVIPFWLRYSGVAAVLLIGFLVFKPEFDVNQLTNNKNQLTKNSEVTSGDTIYSTEKLTQNNLENYTNELVENAKYENSTEVKNLKSSSYDNELVVNSVIKNPSGNSRSEEEFVQIVKSETSQEQTDKLSQDKNYIPYDFKNEQNPLKNLEKTPITHKDYLSDFPKDGLVNADIKNETTIDNQEDNQENRLKKDLSEQIKLTGEETDEIDLVLTPFNKWKVMPNIGPVLMNSLSEGSPISDKFAENAKDYQTSISYGLGLDYSLTKKLSIRTGINKFSTGYNTNDVTIYVSASRLEILENSMNIDILEKNSDIVVASKETNSSNDSSVGSGYVNQKMGYIEVPLELSYKLLDSKFGIEIIGGMSTLFLEENEVQVIAGNMKTTLGKANNLSDTHFSTNIGVGFRYELLKSLDVNLDPMFKYQLGIYNRNSGNFKPYILGLYTRLSYKF